MIILISQSINLCFSVRDGFLRDELLEAKDTRLGLCSESFNAIRTLQMLAWTPMFEERIMVARRRELNKQRLRLWMQKMQEAIGGMLGVLVTYATLSYYVTH